MKKLYSLVFICAIFAMLNNVSALNHCYYKDDSNGLYFYASVDKNGDSPVVLIEKDFKGAHDGTNHKVEDTKWIVDNWKKASSDEVYPAYMPTDSCPKYLVYEQNSGFAWWGNKDYVYFTDDVGVDLEFNSYLLSNYTKGSNMQTGPVTDTGNLDYNLCPYSVTLENGEIITFTINTSDRTMQWKRGDTVIGTDSEVIMRNPSLKFTFANRPFTVNNGEKTYTFFTYYAENKQCPNFDFAYNKLDGIYTLVPAGSNIDGTVPTEKPDPNYKSEFMCEITFAAKKSLSNSKSNLVLKLEKGTTNRICLKFEGDNSYSCSNNWYEPAILYDRSSQNNIRVSFESNSVADYYYTNYLNQGVCPNINDTDIFININKYNLNEYTISTKGDGTSSTNPDNLFKEGLYETFKDSTKYKQLLGGLKSPLSALAPQALTFPFIVDGAQTNLESIDANADICSGDTCTAPKYQTEVGIRNIRRYCNDVYKYSNEYKNSDAVKSRVEECDSFDEFYNKLVEEGIISNLASGCGFVTENLKDFLNEILNYIKIGGPIIAIILGMIDFVKVLSSNDPDKDMQNAGKRFKVRIIAAALLFLIPVLLSTVLNIFIGDKLENDPFCEVIKK